MLSVEILGENIYMVEAQFRRGSIAVSGFGTAPTPEGSVRQGMILNMQDLTGALHDCMQRNRLRAHEVTFSVSSPGILFREVTVPVVKKKELRNLLTGEIEQMNSSKQEYIMDYVILEKQKEEEAEVYRILCIMVPRVLVESYLELAKRLRLKPYGFDVPLNSLRKMAHYVPFIPEDSAVIVAGISEEEIRMGLLESESRVFYRSVPLSVSKDVVESEFILTSIGASNLLSGELKQEQIVNGVVEQISKLIQFQQIKNKGKPVGRVFLSSEISVNEEMVNRISSNLGVECGVFEKPAFVKCAVAIPFSQYLNVISAVIER